MQHFTAAPSHCPPNSAGSYYQTDPTRAEKQPGMTWPWTQRTSRRAKGRRREIISGEASPSYKASWFQRALPGAQQSDHSTDGLRVKWRAALGHVPSFSRRKTSPMQSKALKENRVFLKAFTRVKFSLTKRGICRA